MKKYVVFFCVIGFSFNLYYLFYYRINQKEESLYTQLDLQAAAGRSVKRTITLCNAIEKKDTAYRYMGSEYVPNRFIVTANKKVLHKERPLEIEINNNVIEFSYTYSFAKGLYKGTKRIKLPINRNHGKFNVIFNWKKKPRIRVIDS